MNSHSYKNPEYYSKNNSLQFDFAMKVLEKANISKEARVLDLGCGDGLITSKIAAMASDGCVVGSDISEQMISYANKTYAEIPNLCFVCMDASKNKFREQFDVITSFNALHWVKQQEQALEGLAKAAVEGAEIILLLSHKKSLYHYALDKVCNSQEWIEYFKNYINPRSFFDRERYAAMIDKAGLNIVSLDEEEMIYHFDNPEKLKDFFRAAMANVKQVPNNKKEKFLDDVSEEYLAQLGHQKIDKIPVAFWCLIVHANKPRLYHKKSCDNETKPSLFSKL